MDYEFRYRLNSSPGHRLDGSGQVSHDIELVCLPDDGTVYTDDDWKGAPQAPGHHKTVLVPGADLAALLATGTNFQKVAAYKTLLVGHHTDQAEPMNTNWNLALMQDFMDQNDLSIAAAADANVFILDVATSYPVVFNLGVSIRSMKASITGVG